MQINGALKKDNWVDSTGKSHSNAVVVCTACWMIDRASIPKDVGASLFDLAFSLSRSRHRNQELYTSVS